jgi:TPR repeat protein
MIDSPGGMVLEDLELLIRRAEAGDTSAQRDFAICLHEGNGVPQDLPAAALWLRRAALGGDAWAQTTLAITLRGSKSREDEVEAVDWLRKAAAQGDTRAMMNLGLHEFIGIGMRLDRVAGTAHALASSLAGDEDGKLLFEKFKDNISREEIERVYGITKWPILSIFLGPNLPGNLSEIFDLSDEERNGGSKFERLMEYEKQNAVAIFSDDSIINIAYKQEVRVVYHAVTQSIIDGKFATTFSVDAGNIRLPDGSPAYWRPLSKDMDAFVAAVQLIEMRTWIRWGWTSF